MAKNGQAGHEVTRERPRIGAKRTSHTARVLANGASEATPVEPYPARRRAAYRENAIRPAASRSRKKSKTSATPDSERAVSRRGKSSERNATSVADPSRDLKGAAADARAVPESVQAHFVQVAQEYFFPDGARAFTDRGKKLTTPSENTQVIRDLVAIAQARGWSRIAVSGTERFRREAWSAARSAGLTVTGYRPSAFERERLVRSVARRQAAPEPHGGVNKSTADHELAEASSSAPAGRARRPREHRGRLVEHGAATYRHDPHEPVSYFVKLETAHGDREYWGVDLERAFRESLSQPRIGDEVVLRALRQEPVTVKTQQRDQTGQLVAKDVAAHRNRWSVETRAFIEARADAAQTLRDPMIPPKQATQQHPELLGAYLQVHAAELAARQFRDAEDRRRFVELVRGAVADSVARGEPMPAVRLRGREVERKPSEASRPLERST